MEAPDCRICDADHSYTAWHTKFIEGVYYPRSLDNIKGSPFTPQSLGFSRFELPECSIEVWALHDKVQYDKIAQVIIESRHNQKDIKEWPKYCLPKFRIWAVSFIKHAVIISEGPYAILKGPALQPGDEGYDEDYGSLVSPDIADMLDKRFQNEKE